MTDQPSTRDTAELDRFFQPVLDIAIVVARERAADDGPHAVPARLRPFLRVARLPKAAATAARLTLEEDPDLRAAVAERVSEDDAGRGPWLWVTRPDGWRDDLEGEWVVWEEERSAASSREAEAATARRLDDALAAAERLDARVRTLEATLSNTEDELIRARAAADAATAERDTSAAELARRVAERAEAVRQLKRTEELLAARTAELREVEDLLVEDSATVVEPVASVDRDALAEAIRNTVHQLDPLVRSLSRLASIVGVDLAAADPANPAGTATRRRPARVGRGIAADSTAAADVLLRLEGVVVFVDGYNVTMTVWPQLSIADQRRVLERSATSLATRTGAEMHLIFDGDDTGGAPPRSTDRPVRVRFTSAEVEADDEILDLIATVPTERPVVVVSDDRRVQRGARRRGANVVGSRQLQPLLLR